MTLIVKSLADCCLPTDFDCNEPELNSFLLKHAQENESRGLSSTHLLCRQPPENTEPEILGYFSLSTTPLDVTQLPNKLTKRYPRYAKENLTVTLLARLALDQKSQRCKLGGRLLIDALKTAVESWKYINSIGILVHAKHEKAATFYERYGFKRLPNDHLHLFMNRKDVRLIVRTIEQQSSNTTK